LFIVYQEVKMKGTVLLVVVVFSCISVPAMAASVGNPETLGQGKASIGLEGEYIIDMEFESFDENFTSGLGTVKAPVEAEFDGFYRGFLKLGYGIIDWLDFYALVGTVDGEIDVEADAPVAGGRRFDLDFSYELENDLAYGGGVKVSYPFKSDYYGDQDYWIVGCDAQYIYHESDYERSGSARVLQGATVLARSSIGGKGGLTVYEWHVSPYIAYRINNFTPYVGFDYGEMVIEDETPPAGSTWEFEPDNQYGGFAGCNFELDNWFVSLEGRYNNATAGSVTAGCKF
jgi:hypothetical protein